MSIYATKKDTPYVVEEAMAQLLLERRPEKEKQDVVTECAKVFETMNIRTVRKEDAKDETV